MASAADYIFREECLIAHTRKKIPQYWIFGNLLLRIIGPVLMIAGCIKGLNLSKSSLLVNLSAPVAVWIYEHMHWLWVIVPYPDFQKIQAVTEHPFAPLLSLFGWAAWGLGIGFLGASALKHSKQLAENARKREERLEFHRPLLMHTQQNTISVAGDQNAVNASNTNVYHQPSDKDWWSTATITIVLGIASNLVSKWIGI